jgi:hypothetical protein
MMEMKKISSGRLRAIGYDETARRLCVEFDNGERLEYDNFTLEMWRRMSGSSSPWSYYCDNLRDELTPCRPASADFSGSKKKNPLDDLFG